MQVRWDKTSNKMIMKSNYSKISNYGGNVYFSNERVE